MLILLLGGIFIGSRLVLFAEKILEGRGSLVSSIKQLFLASDKQLVGEENGEIHILLMGIGGAGHEGATLTDTIILATIKLPLGDDTETQVSLVSIPRDLLVNIPGHDYLKINSAYAYGEINGKRQGPQLAIQTIQPLTGFDIPYYGVIDFEGFKKVIDDLGGVEINVEQGFTDAQYPDEKEGFLPPITFNAGTQTMDGTRALQFVRSRHGNNDQGSDFARARRQQSLLKAVKDEASSFRVLSNLGLIDRILNDLSDHIRTNLAPYELKRLYSLTKNIKDENIHSLAIDNQGGWLCDKILEDNGAYVLIPCQGLENYQAIRALFKTQFEVADLQTESPTLEIQNGSNIPQLGERTSKYLYSPFLKIQTGNFKGQTAYQQTVIYDNTGGEKPRTLGYLRDKLGASVAGSPFPFPTLSENPDFVIVVTADIENKL